ncbi:dimethylargininase [Roseovarius azorensis]|uniref:Dimethylargininase n=1 Tax=Roseovarius azorensis TaxID=1287727 RepID=A0A1H7FW56_9RHOB|nr:arginine deiminase family protein [Roseovarius azorensis]SEK30024.1 dimethylargininase [Roseovarius azorensis]
MNNTHEFRRAITRKPGRSIVDGLRAEDIGMPDLGRMLEDHAAYVAALRSTGAEVVELPALETYPDSVFVEDTMLCLPKLAIAMRPGAPTRQGEVAEIRPAIEAFYGENIREITAPGTIEGGDILVTGREILVGLSARTNSEGVSQLSDIVSEYGYSLRLVETPEGVLHFKTDCGLIDPETILSTRRLAASGCFEGYRLLCTPDEEEAASNCIRFNNLVIMAAGFPRTAEMLDAEGHEVVQINNSECARLDGGMSCLSLRF